MARNIETLRTLFLGTLDAQGTELLYAPCFASEAQEVQRQKHVLALACRLGGLTSVLRSWAVTVKIRAHGEGFPRGFVWLMRFGWDDSAAVSRRRKRGKGLYSQERLGVLKGHHTCVCT